MTLLRVLLEPLAPVYTGPHGRARKSGALVHSDTLHAALIDVAALAGLPLIDVAESLRVSSVFPRWRDTLFYPRPFLPPPVALDASTPKSRKRWKSVRLLSEPLLKVWLAGRPLQENDVTVLGGSCAITTAEVDADTCLPDTLFCSDTLPAVVIDRVASRTTPFDRRVVRLNTAEGAGAWFVAEIEDSWRTAFEAVVRLLGEQGLGGERSVGYGHFRVQSIEPWTPGLIVNAAQIPYPMPEECCIGVDFSKRASRVIETEMFLTLSLYLPKHEEVAQGVLRTPAAYDCALRGGWIHDRAGSGDRKRSLRMCVEGSVFPKVADRPGTVRDAAPAGYPHPVWRSGLALPVFFRFAEEDKS